MGTVGELSENPGEFAIEWRIKDFFSPLPEIDTSYFSPVFTFAGASWKFEIFPNGRKECYMSDGKTKNTEGTIALYLHRQSSGPPINLEYSLGLKMLDGNENHKRHLTYNFEKKIGYGFAEFLSISKILEKKSELVPSDALTVVCKMKYPKTADISSKCFYRYCR